MNVRSLCLAILHDGETTGYQIRKLSTEGEFAYFVDASYGSIYPALSRLEIDGMVVSRVEQQEGRPAKKVYSITKMGRETFHQSLFHELDDDSYRSEFLLFSRFVSQLPVSLVKARLNEKLTHFDAEIEQLAKAKTEKLAKADQWIIDYGTACLTTARQELSARMNTLIELAQPDEANVEAAE